MPKESLEGVERDVDTVVHQFALLIVQLLGETDVHHLETIVTDALSTGRFVDDLAELYRRSPSQIASALAGAGLRPLATGEDDSSGETGSESAGWICAGSVDDHRGFTISALGPAFDAPFPDPQGRAGAVESEWSRACARVRSGDPFLTFYRKDVRAFLRSYRSNTSPKIHGFLRETLGDEALRYLVTVGIGANEQFWHFPRLWHNAHRVKTGPQASPEWIIADSPKDLSAIPLDATAGNTAVVFVSRSGKTQEVVKFDEFLDPAVPRIVFANSGPLADAARRSGALRLDLPDEIPGRFSKNLSPVLLAPLDVLGLPIDLVWETIAECIDAWELTSTSSPPAAIARYLRAAQVLHGANHIYLGSNDPMLVASCDELVQFWNEGVNKGSDFSMSRYFGLPRDSHLNIEGILSNAATKTGIFLLRRGGSESGRHPLQTEIRPLNETHAGLTVLDVDYALARANAEHFGSKMPTLLIEVDEPDLRTSAILSQLWTDAVYLYSAMIGVNPGSNPEVREVRDRSDALLAAYAARKA